MKKSEVFKFFENCKLVKGYKRSLICDLQKEFFCFIPNDLCDLLLNNEGKTIIEVKESYKNRYDEIIDEYFEFLIANSFVFFTDTPTWFPKISLDFYYPFAVSNALIDINNKSKYSIYKVLSELELLNCKHIEIRFYQFSRIEVLRNIFAFLKHKESIIISVSITIPFNRENEEELQELIEKHTRFSSLKLSNSEENKIVILKDGSSRYKLYMKDTIEDEKCCGVINKSFFTSNMQLFTESIQHNSCLNKKIAIDVNGRIKNCPSMSQSFGNIKDTTLKEALEHEDFIKYWNITKDQINVCKDCEFRYICTDCRAYTERTKFNKKELDLSKPLKCGYNPYTNEWEEWSTNPLKEKAIEFYGMQELLKKDD